MDSGCLKLKFIVLIFSVLQTILKTIAKLFAFMDFNITFALPF